MCGFGSVYVACNDSNKYGREWYPCTFHCHSDIADVHETILPVSVYFVVSKILSATKVISLLSVKDIIE